MYNLIIGDFKNIHKSIAEESIDLIVTDPPYIKSMLYTYDYLSEYGSRLLKKGGSLLTIVGHHAMPYVISKLSENLKYRWLLSINQMKGKHARMAMGIEVCYKPVLWFVKDSFPKGYGFTVDMVDVNDKNSQNKPLHKWQQSPQWCYHWIKYLSNSARKQNNEFTVLDPYCGTGSTLLACKQLGLNYIGIDIDPKCIELSSQLLEHNK